MVINNSPKGFLLKWAGLKGLDTTITFSEPALLCSLCFWSFILSVAQSNCLPYLQKRPVEDSDWRKNVEAMSGMEGRKKMFDAAKGPAQWSQEVGWGHISDITPLHLNLSYSSWVYCGICVVVSRWCPCVCSCHGGDNMPPHPWKAFNYSVSFFLIRC